MSQPSPQTILLTGGRAPVTLDLARQFFAAGHRVLVADSLKHQLCSQSRAVAHNFLVPAARSHPTDYIKALQHIITTYQVDWLIPTCEEIFYIAAGRDHLNSLCTVFTEPLEKLEKLHNKWTFIQTVKAMGLPAPETWLLESKKDLENVLKEQTRRAESGDNLEVASSQKLVLKPVFSRFASQVRILSLATDEANRSSLAAKGILPTPSAPWVAQTFVTGQQYCVYGIAHQGTLAAFAAYPTLFTAGAGSCIYFQSVVHSGLLTWMQTFVAAQQFTGQIAFDIIETPDKVLYPLECNPRSISAIHLFTPADNLPQAFLHPSLVAERSRSPLSPSPNSPAAIALAMLFYGLPSALVTQRLRLWLHAFTQAKDVIFQANDPLPAFHVVVVLLQFVRMSLQQKQSLQRVSTKDIEWDGEPIHVSL